MSDKQTILANLRKAREILAAAPEGQFDLSLYRQDLPCGTLMCAAGWLASSPEFSDRIELYQDEYSLRNKMWRVRDAVTKTERDLEFLDPIFGAHAYATLFDTRNNGERDHMHPLADEDQYLHPDLSDKELALWRIDQQIEAVEQGEQA